MRAKIALFIARQAIESGNVDIDLSWLSTDEIMKTIEEADMFYCPIEDFGEFQLRTPKGWETEE